MGDEWIETDNGNWVLPGDDGVEATVYRAGSEWGAVWNGAPDGKTRRLKAKLPTAAEEIAATEAGIAEGADSVRWWPQDDQWLPTKKEGFYRKHNGMVISVKQAKSGSWFAANGSASLGRYGRTTWFSTDSEARSAADALVRGSGEWSDGARSPEGLGAAPCPIPIVTSRGNSAYTVLRLNWPARELSGFAT